MPYYFVRFLLSGFLIKCYLKGLVKMNFSVLENRCKKWNKRLAALPEWMQKIFLDDLTCTVENRFMFFEVLAKKSSGKEDELRIESEK